VIESTVDHLFQILALEDWNTTCQLSRLTLKTFACILLFRIDSRTLVEISRPIMMTFVQLHCAEWILPIGNTGLWKWRGIHHIHCCT